MELIQLKSTLEKLAYFTKQNLNIHLDKKNEALNYWIKKLVKQDILIPIKKGFYVSSFYLELVWKLCCFCHPDSMSPADGGTIGWRDPLCYSTERFLDSFHSLGMTCIEEPKQALTNEWRLIFYGNLQKYLLTKDT